MSIQIFSPQNFHHYPAGLIAVAGHSTDRDPIDSLLFNSTTFEARRPDDMHIHPNGDFVIFFDKVKPGLLTLLVFHPAEIMASPTPCVFAVSKSKVRIPGPTIATPVAGEQLESLTPPTGGTCGANPVTSVWMQYVDAGGTVQTFPATPPIMCPPGSRYWSATLNLVNAPCRLPVAGGYTEYAQDRGGMMSQPVLNLTIDPKLCPQAKLAKKKKTK
jgi:hypothetical protein